MTLDARLAARDDLRFTPAGLAALDFQLAHESMQTEANGERRVACELAAAALPWLPGSPLPHRHERRASRERIRTTGRKLKCPAPWEEARNLPKVKEKARTASAASAATICSSERSSAALPPKASSKSTTRMSMSSKTSFRKTAR